MTTKNYQAAIALLFCLPLGRLAAQTPTATLVGTVLDPTGAVVTAAGVEVRNSGTNEVRKAVTDRRGTFTVPDLAAGLDRHDKAVQAQRLVSNTVGLHTDPKDIEGGMEKVQKTGVIRILNIFKIELPV